MRLFPPLLSSYTGGASRWDLWTLGGLGHFSGGEQAGTSHLVPLYYGNRRTGTRLTPLYAAWEADSGRMRFIPPLLTAWRVNDARRTETFLSPLYATWEDDIGRLRAIPPLLSASYRDGDRRGIVGLLGLFHARWGGEAGRRAGHLLPLYYFDDQTFLTPLAGSLKTDGTTSRYWLTPLLGTRSGGTRGSWLFPLYSHSAQPDLQTSQGWFLLAGEYRRTPREDLTRFPLLFNHQRWRNPGKEGERQVQGAVGDHVTQLVEVGAEFGLLAELAGEHAVHGVQRHAQQHPQGNQGEQPGVLGKSADRYTYQHRTEACQ